MLDIETKNNHYIKFEMQIEKLINQIHLNNKSKGFWDDKGSSYKMQECLALCVSELSESIEADRKSKRANRDLFFKSISIEEVEWNKSFEMYIKDSVEDELADTFIRLIDIAGGFGWNGFKIDHSYNEELKNIKHLPFTRFSLSVFFIMKTITDIYFHPFKSRTLGECLAKIKHLSDQLNFDLFWHIEKKLEYNSKRTYKHGKAY
jgi:NTP pyrophosphatase (non-canonical NTP hydrolase)